MRKRRQGHHKLVDALDSAVDAGDHDDEGNGQGQHVPADAAKVAHDGAKVGAGITGQHRSGDRPGGIAQDPRHDYGISDANGQRARHGNDADAFQRQIMPGQGLAEGAQRAGPPPAAKGDLAGHADQTQEQRDGKIGDQERAAAVFGGPVRKGPDVGHAHGGADAGQDESPAVAPLCPVWGTGLACFSHENTSFFPV